VPGIFVTSPPAYQSTPSLGTTAAQVYSGTGVTVGGSAYAFPSGVTLSNLIIQNSGTATAYVGQGSTVSATTGLAILAGSNIVIEASVAQGTASTFNLWGIAAGGTTALEISLGSVDENV
jgi:hypothetical protein